MRSRPFCISCELGGSWQPAVIHAVAIFRRLWARFRRASPAGSHILILYRILVSQTAAIFLSAVRHWSKWDGGHIILANSRVKNSVGGHLHYSLVGGRASGSLVERQLSIPNGGHIVSAECRLSISNGGHVGTAENHVGKRDDGHIMFLVMSCTGVQDPPPYLVLILYTSVSSVSLRTCYWI
jgi:hypothetical protein